MAEGSFQASTIAGFPFILFKKLCCFFAQEIYVVMFRGKSKKSFWNLVQFQKKMYFYTMKTFKFKILSWVYGSQIIEAFTLDMLLSALNDGFPHSYHTFTHPSSNITVWEIGRKSDKLIEDGMVRVMGDNVIITSKGMLHLSKGGYTGEIKSNKHISFSFILSIFAFLVSISSGIFSWLHR